MQVDICTYKISSCSCMYVLQLHTKCNRHYIHVLSFLSQIITTPCYNFSFKNLFLCGTSVVVIIVFSCYYIVKASLVKTPIRRKRKKPASVMLDRSELYYMRVHIYIIIGLVCIIITYGICTLPIIHNLFVVIYYHILL